MISATSSYATSSTTKAAALVLREDRDGITTLTLNRPASYNLLTSEVIDALQSAFDRIEQDEAVHAAAEHDQRDRHGRRRRSEPQRRSSSPATGRPT